MASGRENGVATDNAGPSWSRVEGTLMTTARAVRRAYDDAMGVIGIALSDASVLGALANEGVMTQTQLAERLGTGRARVGVYIDSLESKGAVQRSADPNDRRVWLVSLTPAGRDLWKQAATVDSLVRTGLRAGTTAAHREQLDETLRLILANCASLTTPSNDNVD